MKNLFNKSCIILFSLAFTATLSSANSLYAQQTAHVRHSAHYDATSGASAQIGTEFKNSKVEALYKSYHALYEALVTDNLQSAQKASLSLSTTAKVVPGAVSIATLAKKVAVAKTINAQRKYFSSISNELISIFKKGVLKQGTFYIAFCPMANDGKGAYWLTSEKKIANPYLGSQMPTCGSIKETLK
jgi:hypothetical protein